MKPLRRFEGFHNALQFARIIGHSQDPMQMAGQDAKFPLALLSADWIARGFSAARTYLGLQCLHWLSTEHAT